MDPKKCILIVDDEPNVRLDARERRSNRSDTRSSRPRTARRRSSALAHPGTSLRPGPARPADAARWTAWSCSRGCERWATHVPVVILTAHGSIPEAVDRHEAGRDRFPDQADHARCAAAGRRRGDRAPRSAAAGHARRVQRPSPRTARSSWPSSWRGPSEPSIAASSSEAETACSARSSPTTRTRPRPHELLDRLRTLKEQEVTGLVPHPARLVSRAGQRRPNRRMRTMLMMSTRNARHWAWRIFGLFFA